MRTATPNPVMEFARMESSVNSIATDSSRTVEASHLIGSADLHTGSALIRYIPSHLNQVSYTLAVRPDSPSERKIRRRYGEPTKKQLRQQR